jgi:hypothetical protein
MFNEQNAEKYCNLFDSIIDYYYCRHKFPHLISHIGYTVTEPELHMVDKSNFYNDLYVPSDLIETIKIIKFKFNEKSCKKLSCMPFYPNSNTCNSNTETMVTKSGNGYIVSCQASCNDELIHRDLYWNINESKCVLSNTTKKLFAFDRSFRSETFVPGLSNTSSLDWDNSRDQLYLNKEYCDYFLGAFDAMERKCVFANWQRVTHLIAGPALQKAISSIGHKNLKQMPLPEKADSSVVPIYILNQKIYYSDISGSMPPFFLLGYLEQCLNNQTTSQATLESTRKKRSTHKTEFPPLTQNVDFLPYLTQTMDLPHLTQIMDFIENNVVTNILASIFIDVAITDVPVHYISKLKKQVKKLVCRQSVRSVIFSLSAEKLTVAAIRKTVSNTLTKSLLGFLKVGTRLAKLTNTATVGLSAADIIFSAWDPHGIKELLNSSTELNNVFDTAFHAKLGIVSDTFLEYRPEDTFNDIIYSNEIHLLTYIDLIMKMKSKLICTYLDRVEPKAEIETEPLKHENNFITHRNYITIKMFKIALLLGTFGLLILYFLEFTRLSAFVTAICTPLYLYYWHDNYLKWMTNQV